MSQNSVDFLYKFGAKIVQGERSAKGKVIFLLRFRAAAYLGEAKEVQGERSAKGKVIFLLRFRAAAYLGEAKEVQGEARSKSGGEWLRT